MLIYNQNTPILFIVFKSRATKLQVFEKIRNAKPKRLYLAFYMVQEHHEIEDLLSLVDWDCDIQIAPLENNPDRLINPISWFFAHETEGIILNDDNLPGDSFFGFCSELLEKYRCDERIGHISGSNYVSKGEVSASYYFSSLTNVSGWATWRRVWQTVDMNLSTIDYFVDSNAIESNLSYAKYKEDWLMRFLDYVPHHGVHSWNIPYIYNGIINNYLSIAPTTNLVNQIGEGVNGASDILLQGTEGLQHPTFVLCDICADWEEQENQRKSQDRDTLHEGLKDGYRFIEEKFLELSKQNENMKIPRIIHQIYEDPAGPSEPFLEFAETWKEHHPTWEYRFWGKKEMEDFLATEFPEFIPIYKAYPYNVQRWDAIRYLILYRIGGLYVDFDYECLKPMDALLNGATCCMGVEPTQNAIRYNKSVIVGNALMASAPEHPYFEAVIMDMMKGKNSTNLSEVARIMQETGPFMTTRVYEQYLHKEEITLLPADLVTPFTMFEIRDMINGLTTPYIMDKMKKCFAIHYFGGSWFNQINQTTL